MAKFVINMCEAITAIRAQYQLPESVEIEIVGSSPKTDDESVWHDVPSNWKHEYAPDQAYSYDNIEVMKRSGATYTRHVYTIPGEYWKQEDSIFDIVKFRKAQI